MEEMLPNIPRVYTALAEWSACMLYILLYRRRIRGVRFWGTVGVGFLFMAAFLIITGQLPLQMWMICMAVAVGMMYLMFLMCSELSYTAAGYCTVRAFILAELAASLAWQIYLTIFYDKSAEAKRWEFLCVLVVYAAVYGLMYRLESCYPNRRDTLFVEAGDLWPTALIGISVFFASNMGFVPFLTELDKKAWFQVYKTRTLVDLSGEILLFAHHLSRSMLHIRREYDSIQSVLQNQYMQYCQSRETIDLINRKYHDLKHQITLLRAEPDHARRKEYLDEMEREIRNYEAQNKTGNSVLDTVLTSKSLLCVEREIQFTCVADGKLLADMDAMDICTIFGNVLDNAIECETDIAEKEKRIIHLALFSKKEFLVIRVENYFEGKLDFKEGVPVTTKKDADHHGYGIKSVRYTAEKYGGSVSIRTHENWFEIDILIPRQKSG